MRSVKEEPYSDWERVSLKLPFYLKKRPPNRELQAAAVESVRIS